MDPWNILVTTAFFALMAFLLWRIIRRDRERAKAMRQFGQRNGWKNEKPSVAADALRTHLFRAHRLGRCRNVLSRLHDDTRELVLDFSYSRGGGGHSRAIRQTVLARESASGLPAFELRPEHAGHKLASVLGYRDIDFEHRPEFSRRYLLRGDDEAAVRRCFDVERMRFFERDPGWSVECDGTWLVVYRGRHAPGVDELAGFLGEARGVAGRFES